MTRLFKTLLIWLLILVLPAQAIASTAKSSCGPRHHAVSELGAHGTHALQTHHCSDHSAHAADGRHGAADAGNDCHAAAHGKFKSSFCSACAACCVGAAVIPAMPDWTPASGNSFIAVACAVPALTAYIPSGPERPPRPISL
jgi:hypothetical protein